MQAKTRAEVGGSLRRSRSQRKDLHGERAGTNKQSRTRRYEVGSRDSEGKARVSGSVDWERSSQNPLPRERETLEKSWVVL